MKIVLGTDGSATALAAVRFVAAFPFPEGTRAVLVSVVDPGLLDHDIEELAAPEREAYQQAANGARTKLHDLLDRAGEPLRAAGLVVSTEVRTGHAAAGLIEAADDHDADLIVVGSHGLTGFRRFLLGSVSSHVFRSAERSVLIVREPGVDEAVQRSPEGPWRILLGYDGSAAADRAVEVCRSLDLGDTDAIRALTVLPMVGMFRQDIGQSLDPVWRRAKETSRAQLDDVADRLRPSAADVSTALIEADDVSQQILEAADEFDADLLVLGNKGDNAFRSFLVGSVTSRVAHHARGSVLTVR